MTAVGDYNRAGSGEGLRREAIGLREVLFQSITDMAPGAAIAASIPAGVAFAGGALPLAVVFALIASLFCAWSVGELARHLPAAGSLATYAARGLHPSLGFLVAWGYVLVGALIPPLVLLQLGFTVAATLNSEFGISPGLWWPWTVLGALIVLAAGFYGVRTSTGMGTILGAFEVGVFLVLAVFFVVHAGSNNTGAVFTTTYTPSAHAGFSGVIAGSVYTILAFGGFESAAPLAEEARDPRRTVRRAVLGATLLIGLLYVFTTYAADVAFGPARFSGFGLSGPHSWEGLSRSLYGIFWVFVFFAIVNSTIANANAGTNVSSRTAYAMGRIHAFPYAFARVHLRHRSPYVAIIAFSALSLGIALGLGVAFSPTVGFVIVATALVIVLVGIYIVVDIACIGFFARPGRRFNPIAHGLIPLLGVLTFIPAWLTAAGVKVFSFVTPLTPPYSYAGIAVGGYMFVGLLYLLFLYTRDPGRVTDVGLVHLDAEPDLTEAPPA